MHSVENADRIAAYAKLQDPLEGEALVWTPLLLAELSNGSCFAIDAFFYGHVSKPARRAALLRKAAWNYSLQRVGGIVLKPLVTSAERVVAELVELLEDLEERMSQARRKRLSMARRLSWRRILWPISPREARSEMKEDEELASEIVECRLASAIIREVLGGATRGVSVEREAIAWYPLIVSMEGDEVRVYDAGRKERVRAKVYELLVRDDERAREALLQELAGTT